MSLKISTTVALVFTAIFMVFKAIVALNLNLGSMTFYRYYQWVELLQISSLVLFFGVLRSRQK